MSEWKSNIPEDLDLDAHYAPAKTEKQKKRLSEISKKLNAERLADPDYYDRISKISAENAKNPERNKKLSESSKKYWNSEKGKKQRSEQQKKNWENNKENMTKAMQDRYKNDPFLKKKISEALKNSDILKEKAKKRQNKIMTPDGEFESRKAAAEFYKIDPTQINARIKKWPDKYYYTEIRNGATGYKKEKNDE